MNRKWMIYGAAWLLLLAGCGKSGNNANQVATNTPNGAAAGNQAGPGQSSTPGQANTMNAPAEASAVPQQTGPFQIPAGTSIPVVLTSTLSSKVNQPGEEFRASLARPIVVEGEEAIPKGALVRGTIVDAKKQGTFKGAADLVVTLTSVTVRGKEYPLSTSSYGATQKGKGKRTALVTGGGAALGALIGGLAGGGKGAAIGAGVGGGGGLAASGATGGKNVVLPAESKLTFKLTEPITVER
jgi:hypothetical protein